MDYDPKCSIGKKSGRKPQGACRGIKFSESHVNQCKGYVRNFALKSLSYWFQEMSLCCQLLRPRCIAAAGSSANT
jgi:hypothetical protein